MPPEYLPRFKSLNLVLFILISASFSPNQAGGAQIIRNRADNRSHSPRNRPMLPHRVNSFRSKYIENRSKGACGIKREETAKKRCADE